MEEVEATVEIEVMVIALGKIPAAEVPITMVLHVEDTEVAEAEAQAHTKLTTSD